MRFIADQDSYFNFQHDSYLTSFSQKIRAYISCLRLFLFCRADEEAEFREFLETVAVVLCSDIEISSDTFHRAARGYGVSLFTFFPRASAVCLLIMFVLISIVIDEDFGVNLTMESPRWKALI